MTNEQARQLAAEVILRRHGLSYSNIEDMEALVQTILKAFDLGVKSTGTKPAPNTIETVVRDGITITTCY